MEFNNEICKIPESAKLLRVGESTIRAWIFQRRLPVLHIGRRVFIRREILDRILVEGLEAVEPNKQ